ncbi:hypothetical protein MKX03_014713, partial [Papaver bracteatum]
DKVNNTSTNTMKKIPHHEVISKMKLCSWETQMDLELKLPHDLARYHRKKLMAQRMRYSAQASATRGIKQ